METNPLNQAIEWIREQRPRRIAVLTGAGVSAESGIPTFRGEQGLWRNHRPEELATPEAFDRDPEMVWQWYEWRRDLVRSALPNAAHHALARLEREMEPPGRITIITQNVDALHRRAGSRNVLELHGSIFRARCTREGSTQDATAAFDALPPRCGCGALLRPDVVWFGEMLDPATVEAASNAVADADALLIIGTSAVVYPAAGLAGLLRHGRSIEVNPETTPMTGRCDFAVQETATVGTPPLVEALLGRPA